MARALRTWAINRGGKNSVRNLRYGPRTRLVRGMYARIVENCCSYLMSSVHLCRHINILLVVLVQQDLSCSALI